MVLHAQHATHLQPTQRRALAYTRRCEERAVEPTKTFWGKENATGSRKKKSTKIVEDPVAAARRRVAAYASKERAAKEARRRDRQSPDDGASWYTQRAAQHLSTARLRRECAEATEAEQQRDRDRHGEEARLAAIASRVARRLVVSGGSYERGSCVLTVEGAPRPWRVPQQGWQVGPYHNPLVTTHDGSSLGNLHLFGPPPPLALQKRAFRTAVAVFRSARDARHKSVAYGPEGSIWRRAVVLLLSHFRRDPSCLENRKRRLMAQVDAMRARCAALGPIPRNVAAAPRRRGSVSSQASESLAEEKKTLPSFDELRDMGFDAAVVRKWCDLWQARAGEARDFTRWTVDKWAAAGAEAGFDGPRVVQVPLLLFNATAEDGATLEWMARSLWDFDGPSAATFVQYVYRIVHEVTTEALDDDDASEAWAPVKRALERAYGNLKLYDPPLYIPPGHDDDDDDDDDETDDDDDDAPLNTLPSVDDLLRLDFDEATIRAWAEAFHASAGTARDYTRWGPEAWAEAGDVGGFEGAKVHPGEVPLVFFNATARDGAKLAALARDGASPRRKISRAQLFDRGGDDYEGWGFDEDEAATFVCYVYGLVHEITAEHIADEAWDGARGAMERAHGPLGAYEPPLYAVANASFDDASASASVDGDTDQDDDPDDDLANALGAVGDVDLLAETNGGGGDAAAPTPQTPRARPTNAGVFDADDGAFDAEEDASFHSN